MRAFVVDAGNICNVPTEDPKVERYRPYLTSPFKGRNKDLSQFGRKSPLKRFLSPDDGGTEGGVKTIEDLEGSFFPAKVGTSRTQEFTGELNFS